MVTKTKRSFNCRCPFLLTVFLASLSVTGIAESADPVPLVATDWSASRKVTPEPKESAWKFAPRDQPTRRVNYQPIQIPKRSGFHDQFQGIAASVPSNRILFGYAHKDNGLTLQYYLADLVRGRSIVFDVPATTGIKPMALNDKGNQAIMRRSEWGRGKSDWVELWRFTSAGVKRERRWFPYGEGQDVTWVEFLPGGRVLTVGWNGVLVMWNVEQVKPIYHFQLASGSTPALSPDRKHLFYAQRTSIGVLDVDKGEVLASRKFHGIVWSALRYSPAGDRVACLSHKRLLIFDFASGQTMLNVPKPTSFGKGAFCFVGDHLLVGTRLLYDIKNQLVSWYYEGATGAIELGDHCCFVYNGRQKAAGMVLPERIPHAAVFDAIDKAMLDPEFWVLAKGTTVKVDVSGVSDDNRREQLASSLAKRLTEKGFGVGDDGTITLQANVFNPVEEEVTYNDSPALFDRSGTSAKILKYTSGLKFVYGKETAWESYGSNVPSMLSQRSGESIQDALKRHEKPNYMWFDQVELPNLLRKPGTNSALGMTTISNAGLQEK